MWFNALTELAVDMLTHATDHPPPTTLLVIAGNSDFSYAISILRLRRYDVVLVCPKEQVDQHSQASLYLDWFNDILGYHPGVVNDAPQAPCHTRRSRTSTNATTATVPHSVSPSQDRNTLSTAGSDPSSSSLPSHLPRPPTSRDSPIHQPEFTDDWNEDDSLPPVELVPPSPPLDSKHKNEMERSRTDGLTSIISLDIQRPSSAPPSYSSFSPAPSPSSEDLFAPNASRPFDNTQYGLDQSFSEFVDTEMDVFEYPISQPLSPADTSARTITPGDLGVGSNLTTPLDTPKLPPSVLFLGTETSGHHGSGSSRASPGQVSPSQIPTSDIPYVMTPRQSVLSFEPTSDRSSRAPSTVPQNVINLPTPPAALNSDTSLPPSVPSSLLSMPSSSVLPDSTPFPRLPTSSAIVHPPAPDIVPDHFKSLVEKLQQCRAQGQTHPLRPSIAAEFVSLHRDEIEKLEAASFLRYAQLAEMAGIVELSLPGEKPWIALRPELYDYHVE